MDGRVLDAPYPVRWCIVNLGILPKRPAQSAEAYEKIWTPEGSPLVATSRKVQQALQDRAGVEGGIGHALPQPLHSRGRSQIARRRH